MNDKKLILIFVALIILIIVLFNVVLGMVGGNTKKKKSTYKDKEYVKKVEQVIEGKVTGKYDSNDKNVSFYNLTQQDRDLVDKIIDNVIDMIAQKKTDDINKLLKYNYKSAMFPKPTDLDKFLDNKVPSGDTLVVKDFRVSGSDLYFNIYGEKANKVVLEIKLHDYKDFYSETGEPYIYFSDLMGIDYSRILFNNNSIRIEGSYYIEYKDTISYVVEITNKTNKDMDIDFDGTKLRQYFSANETLYDMVTTRYVTVPAKESIRYEMGFQKMRHMADGIVLNMDINGTKTNTYVYITTGSLDDDDSL